MTTSTSRTRPPSTTGAARGTAGPSRRRRHLTARVVVAVLIGIPATVGGIAIGIPHALAGPSARAAFWLVALLAGVTSLGYAASTTWRRVRWRGRITVLLVGLAIVQFLLFPMSQAVFATNRAPIPPGPRTPADLDLSYDDVALTTPDGVRLAAWYVPSRNGAAVVLLHGSGSTRTDVLDHAAVLAARGYGVLLLDARGHGGSAGHAMDLGWYGDADIAPAVGFLRAASDVSDDRIALVGISMGGEEAIGAAASSPQVRAVVAEGVTGRSGADLLPLRPRGVGRAFSTVFYRVQDTTAEVLSGVAPPLDLRSAVIEVAPRPVLLIAAGDVPGEGAAGRRLQRAAPETVQLWEVPGAGHAAGLRTAPEEWSARVATFLDAALDVGGEERRDGTPR